jgi:hypothetical protein
MGDGGGKKSGKGNKGKGGGNAAAVARGLVEAAEVQLGFSGS